MKILDIMLDLETLGVEENPVIIQLAAVPFNIETGEVLDDKVINLLINPKSSVAAGLTVTGSTIEWWLKQNTYVVNKVFIESVSSPNTLASVLSVFSAYIADLKLAHNVKEVRIWGNGTLADNRWLISAYKAVNLKLPWNYREDSDVRTLVDIGSRLFNFNPKKDVPFEGEPHNAIDDCKHQIKYCSMIYQKLLPVVSK
jgi:hypothetical protein